MILVLLGPPGSGKGTQAKILVANRKWPQLSTGDMLRTAIADGSKLGQEAKTFMERGALVPDAVVIGLIAERSKREDCSAGFILDGFPRTIPQAEALDKMLQSTGLDVNRAVLFEIKDEELVRRLSGRRTCLKCGAMYHIESLKPLQDAVCDACGAGLVQRDDDRAEVIQKRLAVYHQQTAPLAQYYDRQHKLRMIDAARSFEDVTRSLNLALET